MKQEENLEYWKQNAEEDYITTPISVLKYITKLETELESTEPVNVDLGGVSGSAFWNDDKVIDFVNWYIELQKLDFRYSLENRTIIESFKNGDNVSKWHCH